MLNQNSNDATMNIRWYTWRRLKLLPFPEPGQRQCLYAAGSPSTMCGAPRFEPSEI